MGSWLPTDHLVKTPIRLCSWAGWSELSWFCRLCCASDKITVECQYNKMVNTKKATWKSCLTLTCEPRHDKTCLMLYANNKDVDQPEHPRNLINVFVLHCLGSTISSYIPSFKTLAVEAGFGLTRSQTPKTAFLVTRLMCNEECTKKF